MNQLASVDSGNKLQRQKKSPCSLGERKAKETHPGEEEKRLQCAPERVCLRKEDGGERSGQARERERERERERGKD